MVERIIFYLISISLIVIFVFKNIQKKEKVYLILIILQLVGVIISIVMLMLKIKLNLFLIILTYLISIIVPIFLLVCEYKKINLIEKIDIFIAKIYLFKKNNKVAKKRLIALIEKNEKSKQAHKLLAQIYEKEGGLRKAIDEYVKVVDLDNNSYDSYFKVASLLKELGNKQDSQEMLAKLVNKKPDYVEAGILLCDLLCEQERYKEAINIMNEITKYNPNNYDVYYNMGMIYTMLNDFNSAKTCYEKAAIINSLEHNTNYNIAMIELIFGELEEAEKYFNTCIEDEILSGYAYYQLAKIYMKKSDKDTAIKALNIAIEIDFEFYKKAIEDSVFIPIKGYINYPVLDEEEKEEKQNNIDSKQYKIINYLDDTYNIVGKLNYKDTLYVKYNTKEKQIENNKQRE